MKAVFSNEAVNSFGFRVITVGISLGRYLKNPVITPSHNRDALSIGKVKELVIEGNELTGVPEFDVDDPVGKTLNHKYEKGYMNAFSVGLKPVKWDDSEELKLPGQSGPTLVESELIEIAAVTIPSNEHAVTLYDETGNIINLSFNQGKNMKKIAVILQLSDNATEAEVAQRVAEIVAENAAANLKIQELQIENQAFKKEAKDKEMANFKIKLEDKKKALSDSQKVRLSKIAETDMELALGLLNEMQDVPDLHKVPGQNGKKHEGKKFSDLQKENPKYLEELKANDYEEFAALYEAEFGKKPKN